MTLRIKRRYMERGMGTPKGKGKKKAVPEEARKKTTKNDDYGQLFDESRRTFWPLLAAVDLLAYHKMATGLTGDSCKIPTPSMESR